MTKPDEGPGGGIREGFLGDILDKVKDLISDDVASEQEPSEHSGPAPECAGGPIGHHDSEHDVPPPVTGTVA
ncbi:MAG TPA: hypothetical protein VF821_20035 [Lentzea sp.]